MSSVAVEAPAADPISKPWTESLSDLRDLILGGADDLAVSVASLRILSSSSRSDGDGDDSAPPPSARDAAATVHARSLLRSGRHAEAAEFCASLRLGGGVGVDDPSAAASTWIEEEAYALYRSRRYVECRSLCEEAGGRSSSGGGVGGRGLEHTRAQALYRLRETSAADEAYRRLLVGTDAAADADEREDALANALANRAANYTAGSLLPPSSGGKSPSASAPTKKRECWLEGDAALVEILERYGSPDGKRGGSEDGKGKEDGPSSTMQNYDLVYNLATFLLVTSDARPLRDVVGAKNLLVEAERSALTVLESASGTADDDGGETATAEGGDGSTSTKKERKKEEEQRELAEREAGPIRANLALANLLLRGEDNERGALKACLGLITKRRAGPKKNGSAGGGAGGGIEANLLAAASNNLAVLREGKEPPLAAASRRVPSVSDVVSEDATGDAKGAVAATAPSLAGNGTPQQMRTAMYNRALLLARAAGDGGGDGGGADACERALAELRASLVSDGKGGGGGGKKIRKKKAKAAAGREGIGIAGAVPATEAEVAAWNARADLVEAELRRVVASAGDEEGKGGDADGTGKGDAAASSSSAAARRALDAAVTRLDGHEGGAASYARAELMLYRAEAARRHQPSAVMDLLASLPEDVRVRPGVAATLAAARRDAGGSDEDDDDLVLASLGGENDVRARAAAAELKMKRGLHGEAAKILEGLLGEAGTTTNGSNGGGGGMTESQVLAATASLVVALSRTDPERAAMYAERLPAPALAGDSIPDGDELESRGVPRFFAKKALPVGSDTGRDGSGGSGSESVRKIIAATGGGKGRSNVGERKKKNPEAILRHRARKRELHLAELQKQGRHNPDRPSRPDPERWIPKSQRSYNRRGRRGRGRGGGGGGVGAQGGGIGAGADRDAARLDVAARVAAAKAGGSGADGNANPSTAHIIVSGGTTRKGKGGRRR